jgi:DUF1009 family protein
MPEAPEAPEAIGIIAGAGQFPRMVAQGARDAGFAPVICGFHGHTAPELAREANAFALFHLGQFSGVVRFLREHKVRRLCFAGAISKPKAMDFRPDWMAVKIVFSLREKGDDALLRAIIRFLEGEGFSVLGAADLAPILRCPAGVLTRRAPSAEDQRDIDYGWPIARAMGRYDIGQTIVVKNTMVIAVECLEGTDATLIRGGELGGEGCTAIKVCKPSQDVRVDLPSFGLDTVRLLARHKYRCLAVSAGNSLFFDRPAALAEADAQGIAVVAIDG